MLEQANNDGSFLPRPHIVVQRSSTFRLVLTIILALAIGLFCFEVYAHAAEQSAKPTVVLVHGAFAESASWNGVISRLSKDGYHVVAAATPLRSVHGDAAYISALIANVKGPIILVGHSYGGLVITSAALGRPNVKALVYVDAFEPDAGETALGLSKKFPGSTLGSALSLPVILPDGDQELYISQDKFHAQFAADVPTAESVHMAVTQRPITLAALNEPSGKPAWRQIPSWSIYGGADRNIPPAALAFIIARPHARRTIEIKGGSHVVMVSHPGEVAAMIEEAARVQ